MVTTLVVLLCRACMPMQETPATAQQQYQTILKEFGAGANANWKATTDQERKQAATIIDPLPLKLLELAKKHPREPWTLDALTQIITMEYWLDNYTLHTGWDKASRQAEAIAILLRDHLASDKIAETCKRAQYGFRSECEVFLREVLEKSPHRSIQGQACMRLASFLNGRLQRLDLLKEQPAESTRYERLYGQDYLEALRGQDRNKVQTEIEALLERAIKQFGDVSLPYGETVGEVASKELFALRHLAIGKLAPDIAGPDQHGVRFKLSDYRGKVVLLYFWQLG